MSKLVVTMFVTLDGVIEAPHEWSFPYWSDDAAAFKSKEMEESDALLLGRVTYEGFAQAWPGRTDETGYADKINSMPKYVATKTLTDLSWDNSHILEGNIVEAIKELKEAEGQDIVVHGSGNLIQTLIEHDLVDEYRLMVYPLVLGKGQRLFTDDNPVKLKLVESQVQSTGVVVLIYHPDRSS